MERPVAPSLVQDLPAVDIPRGDLHLRFELSGFGSYAFAAAGVVEVVDLTAQQVTAIPNTAPALVGTFNLRGEIIWVLDLQYCLHGVLFNTLNTAFPVIVIQDGEHLLGLAVSAIQGMAWLRSEEILPGGGTPQVEPFLRGSTVEGTQLLDTAAIVRSQCWARKFSPATA